MANTKAIHVLNLEKYSPGYKDRALSWIKIYCRDSFDKKTNTTYHNLWDDPAIQELDEINRYRFISLVAREVNLGRPVPLDDRNVNLMGWDLEKCPKSRTIQVLHKLTVSVTENPVSVTQDSTLVLHSESEAKAKGEAKGEDKAKAKPQAEESSLSLSRSERIAASLRQHLRPASSSDEIALNGVALWTDREIQDGRRPTTFEQQVRDRAYQSSQRGDKPIALFFKMLHDDLGYPS